MRLGRINESKPAVGTCKMELIVNIPMELRIGLFLRINLAIGHTRRSLGFYHWPYLSDFHAIKQLEAKQGATHKIGAVLLHSHLFVWDQPL
mmetsp:Transcript_32414/g.68525  ORF Transcript_32414/g.68525 Transcript_32414/m.68525 type:complete len:91 (+) Transcript_32414:119-391(+)